MRNPTIDWAMKTLRRYDIRHMSYFLTNVTFERRKILLNDSTLFWQCWKMPNPVAWAILPDHFHVILDIDKKDISEIMHDFKITYSRHYRDRYGPGKIWQNRFWDHIIRDEDDMNRHIDYIRYNPVKHGLVNNPFGYAHSSLNKYSQAGRYMPDWGIKCVEDIEGDFGE